jgi:class 3 adenylate cyclase
MMTLRGRTVHRELKDLLPSAVGQSHLAVVVFADVRGFSSFARMAESAEAALFLRSAYSSILDDYYPNASFFKPTGDGLLIILDYDDSNLSEVVNSAVRSAIKLVEEFRDICRGDAMVNFDVPGELGVGIARGAATALVSGGKTLDYSGRPLNLAARLMDLARPSGVVFSDNLVVELLDPNLAERFSREQVYVKGIAEAEPTGVHILRSNVVLPESSRQPPVRYQWKQLPAESMPFREFSQRAVYLYRLPEEPALTSDLRLHVTFPKVTSNGRRHPSINTTRTYSGEYTNRLGVHMVRLDHEPIRAALSEKGIKQTWPLEVVVEYAVVGP